MRSALELFTEQGFEKTTTLEVAERAGVTERTFYRYFSDKREVLFNASNELQSVIIAAIDAAPPSTDVLETVVTAMEAGAAVLEENRSYSQARAKVIAANPSLQERELLKFSTMSAATSAALRAKGVSPLAAAISAESGATIFKIAFETWIGDDSAGTFAHCIRTTYNELRALAQN